MDSLRIPSPCGKVNGIKSVFTFEWTIKNFISICDKVKPMKFIRSPMFPTSAANEHKCYMKLYPNGDRKENEGFLCIFVQYVNEDGVEANVNKSGVEGNCTFNLLYGNNQVYKSVPTPKDKNMLKGGRLIEQYTVLTKTNGILNDSSMTVTCEISEEIKTDYEKLNIDMEKQIRLKEFDKFEVLFENEEQSDVVIIVEDKKIPAHKCILSTRSSVFAAMFQHKMKENEENIVLITDIKYEVMRELLHFIYVGKVNDIKELACELYEAADKYDLHSLKAICEDAMCENLNTKNVFDYLQFTHSYKSVKKLKAATIDFISLHAEELKPIF